MVDGPRGPASKTRPERPEPEDGREEKGREGRERWKGRGGEGQKRGVLKGEGGGKGEERRRARWTTVRERKVDQKPK